MTRGALRIALIVAPFAFSMACAEGDGPDDAGVDAHADARTDAAMSDSPRVDAITTDAPLDDTSADDVPTDMPSYAGTYMPVDRHDVTPVLSVRELSITFDPVTRRFVTAYTWVSGGFFHTEARSIGADATSFTAGGPVLVDDTTATHNSATPAIAPWADASGTAKLLVVYSDDRLGGGNGHLDIYGQFVVSDASDPTVLRNAGAVFDISQVDPGNEFLPAVASLPGAGFCVLWADDRERATRDPDGRVLFARHIGSDGAIGPEIRVGDDVLFQTFPQIVAAPDAAMYLAAWSDYVTVSGQIVPQYRARRLSPDCTPMGDPFLVAQSGTPSDLPAMAYDSRRGRWLLAWGGEGPPNVRQIHTAFVDRAGAVTPIGMPTMQSDGAIAPQLAYARASDSFLLTYHSQELTQGYAIELGPDGHEVGTVYGLTASAPSLGTFWNPVAADTRAPHFLVVETLDYNRVGGSLFVSSSAPDL